MTPLVLPIAEVGPADQALVGGKGANLGILARAGFAVPPGFCVTTEAYRRFVARLEPGPEARLDGLTGDDLARLRRVAAEVLEAWRSEGTGYGYAVRSSATAEDQPDASFAGQQETYLNVRGEAELLAAVRRCFASLFTDRAILYRRQQGYDQRQVALAVVVQRMVDAEVAGILFTADPVSGHRGVASIDASFGLGEAVVSGVVSADLIRVDRRAGRIVERRTSDKRVAIRPLPGGGVERVELDDADGARAALDDRRVLELASIGDRVEGLYGAPQDIEWALAGGGFYLTQTRPITSLYPLPEPRPDDDALHAYASFGHVQMMTDPMTPLAISVWRTILPVGHDGGRIESRFMVPAGSRIYIDLSPVLRHPVGRRLVPRALRIADRSMSVSTAALVERPRFRERGPRVRLLPLALRLARFPARAVRRLLRGAPEGMSQRWAGHVDALVADFGARLDAAPELSDRLELAVTELRGMFGRFAVWVPDAAAGMIAGGLLHRLLRDRADPDDLIAVGRGLDGNVATEMDLVVGDLGDAANASEPLLAWLSRSDLSVPERLEGLPELPGGEAFLAAWRAFLARYGARGPSEVDLRRPRWSEDPSSLLQMVLGAARNRERGAHRRRQRELKARGEAAGERLLAGAREGPAGGWRARLVRRLVRVHRHLAPLRELHKFMLVRVLQRIKPVLLEAGQVLAAAGRTDTADDVWFLTFPELFAALADPELELRTRIAERRGALERHRRLSPPRLMTSDGEIVDLAPEGGDAPDGALVGSPVSAGVVEGIARVVRDPAVDALDPGEILVAPFTDPGWTPLFVHAGGLVTEVGGLMTHGSVVAREYGIPAVVGVSEATRRIRTGQRLRLDGGAGWVELLDDGNADEGPSA